MIELTTNDYKTVFTNGMEAYKDKDLKKAADKCINCYKAFNYISENTLADKEIFNSLNVIGSNLEIYVYRLVKKAIEYVEGLENAIEYGFFNKEYIKSTFSVNTRFNNSNIDISSDNKLNMINYYNADLILDLSVNMFNNSSSLIASVITDINTDVIDYKNSYIYKDNVKNKDLE